MSFSCAMGVDFLGTDTDFRNSQEICGLVWTHLPIVWRYLWSGADTQAFSLERFEV